jgi:hypothetical protein
MQLDDDDPMIDWDKLEKFLECKDYIEDEDIQE